tara:strand:+ start:1493 stop:1867 length:375 start_codon:yes stop_codon:yes gene_type:complete
MTADAIAGSLINNYRWEQHCDGDSRYGTLWPPTQEEAKKFLGDILDVMDDHNGDSNVIESEKITIDQVLTIYLILEQRRRNNLAVLDSDARDELYCGIATAIKDAAREISTQLNYIGDYIDQLK